MPPDSSKLRSPFVALEPDDSEAAFFATLQDILDDRFDCLWQERYVGYDAAGQKFHLRRVAKKQRWYERLLNTQVEYLELIEIEAQAMPEEASLKVRRWLDLMLRQWPEIAQQLPDVTAQWLNQAHLPDLLAAGLRFDAIAAKTTRRVAHAGGSGRGLGQE